MAVSIVLTMLGLGGFCTLLFNFAVYALPLTIGLLLGALAIHTGAGAIGGAVVGVIAGTVAFALGHLIFASNRSFALRWLVALPFAAFAAYAGYSIVLKLCEFGMPSSQWHQIFAIVGAGIVGGTAISRLANPLDPPPVPHRVR